VALDMEFLLSPKMWGKVRVSFRNSNWSPDFQERRAPGPQGFSTNFVVLHPRPRQVLENLGKVCFSGLHSILLF
jgi:hypothetical protein